MEINLGDVMEHRVTKQRGTVRVLRTTITHPSKVIDEIYLVGIGRVDPADWQVISTEGTISHPGDDGVLSARAEGWREGYAAAAKIALDIVNKTVASVPGLALELATGSNKGPRA